jgi:hypothetical protein
MKTPYQVDRQGKKDQARCDIVADSELEDTSVKVENNESKDIRSCGVDDSSPTTYEAWKRAAGVTSERVGGMAKGRTGTIIQTQQYAAGENQGGRGLQGLVSVSDMTRKTETHMSAG